MALTPAEEQELAELESLAVGKPSSQPSGLTPEEETELSYLEKFANSGTTQRGQGIPNQQERIGLFSRIGKDISKRIGNIEQEDMSFRNLANLRQPLHVAGQLAGGVNDVAGELMKSGYETLVPESVRRGIKTGISELGETNMGQAVAKTLGKTGEHYSAFKEQSPEVAKDIESFANIATFLPISKATGVAGKEIIGTGSDIGFLKNIKALPLAEKKLDSIIDRGIEKAIRPTVVGKSSSGQLQAYAQRAREGVKSIVQNKNNLSLTDDMGNTITGLPKNLKQFSQAIDQTKRQIFEQYNTLASQAGAKEVVVNMNPLMGELNTLANNKVAKGFSPHVTEYANQRLKSIAENPISSPADVQDAIEILNKRLGSFYKNPSFEGATSAYVDSIIAKNLRDSLDNAIEKGVGKNYQELKNKYGALKTIEKEVTNRAIVDARKNIKGLIDFSDIYSSGWIMQGILSGHPATVGAGLSAKGVKYWLQRKNDPNLIVKSLFENIEKMTTYIEKTRQPFAPQSKIGKILEEYLKQ